MLATIAAVRTSMTLASRQGQSQVTTLRAPDLSTRCPAISAVAPRSPRGPSWRGWFNQIEDQRSMQLISVTSYQNGVVGLCYRAM